MHFKATVTFDNSVEQARQQDVMEAKELLLKALNLIAKGDDSIISEARTYLDQVGV